MRLDLNRRELHLIRLWWLSCEDMMIPEGTCDQCELREECHVVRKKLYGKNGGVNKSKAQLNNDNKTTAAAPEPLEELIPT